MNGNCYECEFYNRNEDLCMRAGKAFGSMMNPVCLAKIQCILLRDLTQTINNYLFEDDEDTGI